MPMLYHYTNKAGRDAIYSTGVIQARHPGDGEIGVYFTELHFRTPKADLLANNFGSRSTRYSRDEAEKIRYWFKFDLDDLPDGTTKLPGTRNVWHCPTDVPVTKKTILYHYTDKTGKDAIYNTGMIKAVRPHRGQGIGALMPVGVYFTQLKPDSPKADLLYHMYGTRDTTNQALVDKTRYWFRFFSDELPGVFKRTNAKSRNEWVCPNDVPVRNVGRSANRRGQNGN